jgi:hypothetical protein
MVSSPSAVVVTTYTAADADAGASSITSALENAAISRVAPLAGKIVIV